ncbi:hypothetical protein FJT64_022686 [Amphibalanus amphitrite]|uniref:Uncharacterized protein n=1 Tax=Amphibalanus amphitrite TaxID=1232801 RepID=A0A6A4WSW7_AMPAM|nr:hypothetical protein FJT64_022686 [Amphibalanus amphitrite]
MHWDGKLLEDKDGKGERLAVMVSGNTSQCNQGKILSARKISDGTGESQASEALQCIQDWKLKDSVRAMSYDTTASNTGWEKGAAIRLEAKLSKKLLYTPCRHHIQELSAKAVWVLLFGKDQTPETKLFKVFKNVWSKLNKTQYETLQLEEDDLKQQATKVLTVLACIRGK